MADSPVRLGIIGCGKHARKAHGAALQKLPHLFTIESVHDLNSAAMDGFVKMFPDQKVKICGSSYEVLAGSCEAVLIATPPDSHLDLMEAAIHYRKHIFCEKPLWGSGACTAEYAKRLLAKTKDYGLVLTSCHPRRFEEMFACLRSGMTDWTCNAGRALQFNFRFFYHEITGQTWRNEDSLLLDHLNHEIDIANYVLGPSGFWLRKLADGYDRYHAMGMRNDGTALNFSGYRTLKEKNYFHECEIVFEKFGKVTATSSLQDGILKGFFTNNMGHVDLIAPVAYADLFVPMMDDFYAAIKFESLPYLTLDEMYLNTLSGIELRRRGEFLHVAVPKN